MTQVWVMGFTHMMNLIHMIKVLGDWIIGLGGVIRSGNSKE